MGVTDHAHVDIVSSLDLGGGRRREEVRSVRLGMRESVRLSMREEVKDSYEEGVSEGGRGRENEVGVTLEAGMMICTDSASDVPVVG